MPEKWRIERDKTIARIKEGVAWQDRSFPRSDVETLLAEIHTLEVVIAESKRVRGRHEAEVSGTEGND